MRHHDATIGPVKSVRDAAGWLRAVRNMQLVLKRTIAVAAGAVLLNSSLSAAEFEREKALLVDAA